MELSSTAFVVSSDDVIGTIMYGYGICIWSVMTYEEAMRQIRSEGGFSMYVECVTPYQHDKARRHRLRDVR